MTNEYDALLPGDVVCKSDGKIWGHGTTLEGNKIYSTFFGTPKYTDMLVTVVPHHRFYYLPEAGDVVVGRITGIGNKKWKVEIGSLIEATLALSAIDIPGVVQRRKVEEDEMDMENIFDVGDVVVCEVQKVSKKGLSLHTRNERYGKLTEVILVSLPPAKIVSQRSSFMNCGTVEIVAGCNGSIWIGAKSGDKAEYLRAGKLKRAILEALDADKGINICEIVQKVDSLSHTL